MSDFMYSICYPDREDIVFPEQPITTKQVLQLVERFDWKKETKKEVEFYSPSLDFVRISDKHRFILSGSVINAQQQSYA